MPKQLNFKLTEDELKVVEEAMESDQRGAVRQRATALRMLHLGYPVGEVATILAVTGASIYGWVRRWEEGGVGGLANRPRQVGPRKVTEGYRQALEQALDGPPGAYGYPFAVWTLERLREHLRQVTGIEVSIQWLSVVLKEEGYVYRRPKHDLTHLQDPAAKQHAITLLEALKRGPKQTLSGFSLWTKHP